MATAHKPTVRADRVGANRTAFDKNRQVILKTQTICGICGDQVDFSFKFPHPLSPTVDHIIPISKGGHPFALENLQLAHRYCNRAKSDKLFRIEAKKNRPPEETGVDNNNLPQHFNWAAYVAT